MTRSLSATVLALTILAGACASSNVAVSHDADPAARFSTLRAYRWLPQGPGPAFLDTRVKSAVNAQLVTKGYDPQPHVAPDFFVAYHVVARDRVDVRDWGYAGGRFGRSVSLEPYTEGTLIVDIVDARTMQLVWRGTARGPLDPEAAPAEKDARLKDAVARMMAPFPSRAVY